MPVSASAQALQSDMGELLRSGQCSDVVLKVGDETIPAHKAVLVARWA